MTHALTLVHRWLGHTHSEQTFSLPDPPTNSPRATMFKDCRRAQTIHYGIFLHSLIEVTGKGSSVDFEPPDDPSVGENRRAHHLIVNETNSCARNCDGCASK